MNNSKIIQPWIPLNKVETFVQLEPGIFIFGLTLTAWIGFKFFQKHISKKRELNLKLLFKNLAFHILISSILFIIYYLIAKFPQQTNTILRLKSYVGFLTIISGSISFIKAWRIVVLEYLLLSHIKGDFPVLLVNLFTLILSIILGSWIISELFNVRLTPLLATSAMFSIILGLALQDTLGNLFSGVALQVDKPYEIGDWVEVQITAQKWVGQVSDISWRATILTGTSEESITIPNRVIGQAQISNFSGKYKSIVRSQVFRLPFGVDIQKVKETLLEAAQTVSEIRKIPGPAAQISETTESWIGFKLVYYIDNYGNQSSVADQIFTKSLAHLQAAGFKLSGQHVRIEQTKSIE